MRLAEVFLKKRVLGVFAHPDDEAFCAGGFLHANSLAGGRNFLWCATAGEKGGGYLGERDIAKVKVVRSSELFSCAEFLSVQEIKLLDMVDGDLALVSSEELFRLVLTFALEVRPDVVLGFAEDGLTGHKDHLAVFGAGLQTARFLNVPYLGACLPPDPFGAEMKNCLCKKQTHSQYQESVVARPTLRLSIDGAKKLSTLRLHASQWPGLDPYKIFPPHLAEHFLSFEYFKEMNM